MAKVPWKFHKIIFNCVTSVQLFHFISKFVDLYEGFNLLYHYVWINIAVCLFVCFMVFNITFNNISVISWWSVLLVEVTGVPEENHQPVTSHWQTLSHNVVYLALIEIRTHNISGDINIADKCLKLNNLIHRLS